MVALRALAHRALALCAGLSSLGHAESTEICGITKFNTAAECAAWKTFYEEEPTCASQQKTAGILVLGPGATFQDFNINDAEVATSDSSVHKEFTGTGSMAYECAVSENIELDRLGNDTMDVNSLTFQSASATFKEITITDDHTGDDGIQLFASNVTVDRLIVASAGDDNLDLDDGAKLVVRNRLVVTDFGQMPRADKKGAAVEMNNGAHIIVKRFEFSRPDTFKEGHWYFTETMSDGISIKTGGSSGYLIESTWSAPDEAPTSTTICGIKIVDTPEKCQELTGTFTVRAGCALPTGVLVIGAGEFNDFKIGQDGTASPLRATFRSAWGRRFSCAIGDLVMERLGQLAADVNTLTFQGVDVTAESIKVAGDGGGDDGVELFASTLIVKGALELDGVGDDFLDLSEGSTVDVRGELRIKGLNAGAAGVEMNGRSSLFAKKVTFEHPASSFGEGHFYLKMDTRDYWTCSSGMVCYSNVDIHVAYAPPEPMAPGIGSADATSKRRCAILLQAFLALTLASTT